MWGVPLQTWLQYLFPFYMWFLVAVTIFFVPLFLHSHEADGHEEHRGLATLFLLSYVKLLNSIVSTLLSLAVITVYSAHNVSDLLHSEVWLYDANLPYPLGAKHWLLFAVVLI